MYSKYSKKYYNLSNNKKTKKKIISTKSSKLLIGCHSSITPSILEGLQYVYDIGANAAQIFLGNNKSASLKTKTKLSNKDIYDIRKFINQSKMVLIIHTIYLLNLCKAPSNSGQVKWMHANILHDMKYGARIGAKCVVVHLGSRMKLPIKDALDNLISNINHILSNAPHGIQLSLETSAGAGSQVGYTLEELGVIWNGIKHHGTNRVGICIDTSHIFVAGEKINTPHGIRDYLHRFNNLIGIRHITNFHLNDSKYSIGSRHDKHQRIGTGQIYNTKEGLAALTTLTHFAYRHKIPIILETQGSAHSNSNNISSHLTSHSKGYKWEISFVKSILSIKQT